MKLTTDEKLDKILEALADLQTRKTGPKPALTDGHDLTRERVEMLETLFWKIINAPKKKKIDIYRVPALFLEGRGEPPIEAVVASVLCNQASLRRVFSLVGVGDVQKESPLDRARRALALSNLVVREVSQLKGGGYGKSTNVAMSPGEAKRLVNERNAHFEPLGWTTKSRAVGYDDPTEGWVDANPDTCGVRVWPVDVTGAEEEPRKMPRVVISLEGECVKNK
jgi:hypothetical protein